MNLQPGAILEKKYRIVRKIGEGGMGAVFEARHTRIDRRVAIKVLIPHIAHDEIATKRFAREARTAGQIESDHVVEVFDFGELDDGELYIVMEYLEGESLADRIGYGTMPPKTIFRLVIELLEGLAAAHALGIVHRDLKPQNIHLLPKFRGLVDFVKIFDFGISKLRSAEGVGDQLTSDGATLGTPTHMAPEQCRGSRDVDHRADLYSVGVILFRAMTGALPIVGHNVAETMFKVAVETAPPLTDYLPNADPEVVRIVAKALAHLPEDRYASATELRDDLIGWLKKSGLSTSLEQRRSLRDNPSSSGEQDPPSSGSFAVADTEEQGDGTVRRAATVVGMLTPPTDLLKDDDDATNSLTVPLGDDAVSGNHTAPLQYPDTSDFPPTRSTSEDPTTNKHMTVTAPPHDTRVPRAAVASAVALLLIFVAAGVIVVQAGPPPATLGVMNIPSFDELAPDDDAPAEGSSKTPRAGANAPRPEPLEGTPRPQRSAHPSAHPSAKPKAPAKPQLKPSPAPTSSYRRTL